jgi:penicillin-binding protein 1C
MKKLSLSIKFVIITFTSIIVFKNILFILPYNDLDSFLKKPYSIEILDRNGNLLQVLTLNDGLRREYIGIKEIPYLIKEIFIKSEDKRFYYHCGVDFIALARSVFINLKYKNTISGASTITMQLARIISPHANTYGGKILEIINAIRLEAKLPKDKIFELWINSMPYGYQSMGIKTASKTFFGKDIKNITPAEALSLAVIPRSPEKYNTFNRVENLKKASHILAKRINFKIDNKDIENDIKKMSFYKWEFNAPHFINFIKNQLTQKELSSGKPVITSLDYKLTNLMQSILNEKLRKYKDYRVNNGAILLINNSTGEIIGYVGSNDFFDKINSGEIDGVHILNQPGSAIKPFLYALALDKGILPSDILPDVPMDFGGSNVYVPLNFNKRFNGPVRLRVALASSLNVPAVYLVTRLGVKNFINKLLELDFDSVEKQKNYLGSGIAVGNLEISLYELTRAFSIFPRSGEKNNLTFRKQNNDYYTHGEKIYSDYTSFIICDILSDSESRVIGFGSRTMFDTPYPCMFKTGTSNQFNNTWALGATPEYTIGCWMGNFSGETVIGKAGSSVPAEVIIRILNSIYYKRPAKNFKKIENIKQEIICPLSGGKVTKVCPGAVYEYFKENITLQDCDYHKLNSNGVVTVRYPDMFAKWSQKYEKTDSSFIVNSREKFPKIVRPKNNSLFYYDASIPPDNQAIKIEILNNNKDDIIDLFINGYNVQKLKFPYDYYMKIQKGSWKITAEGLKGSDEINIIVK